MGDEYVSVEHLFLCLLKEPNRAIKELFRTYGITTYCNAVNMWISGTQSTEEIQQIYYGADVPEQYQSDVLKAYISSMKEGVSDVDESQATEQISVPV